MKLDKDAICEAVSKALQHGTAEIKVEAGHIVVLETRRKVILKIPIEKTEYSDAASGQR